MTEVATIDGFGSLDEAAAPAELMQVLERADAVSSLGRKMRRSALAGGLLDAARAAYRAEITAVFARLEVMVRAAAMLPGRGVNQWVSGDLRSSAHDFGISHDTAARWKRDTAALAGAELDPHREQWLELADLDPRQWVDPTIAEVVKRATSGPDDEWYTPRWLFDALGLTYDLDVCAPVDRTHVATPAERFLTVDDDGLAQPWDGLVWCNPPYSSPTPWAERMIDHGNGVLLSHVPINGLWCLRAWNTCTALRMLQGMEFVRPSGELQRPAYWLQLVAFGDRAADAVVTMTARLDPQITERFRPSRAWT